MQRERDKTGVCLVADVWGTWVGFFKDSSHMNSLGQRNILKI